MHSLMATGISAVGFVGFQITNDRRWWTAGTKKRAHLRQSGAGCVVRRLVMEHAKNFSAF